MAETAAVKQARPVALQSAVPAPAIPIPDGVEPSAPAYGVQQLTQFNVDVPATAWTAEVLKNYHDKATAVIFGANQVVIDNNQKVDQHRQREFMMAVLLFLGFLAIVGVALWLYYVGKDLGRDLVIATVSAGAGFAAGYGVCRIWQQ